MKLQQLTIHNIASIEDATIDFDAQPLADSEVFLITGKTGAGKSTILDAICLALFANTPRLVGTQMEGNTKDEEKNITIKDPRQLMRRNTGEAYVRLTFIGSNGVHYEATWSVARARNKVTGNLQNKKWSLKKLETGVTIDKDADIKAEINAAIGLDFNQFCRTTLLAQGEFTKFLNSKDEEKAAILEKITGVDVYAKIGKKVYEVTGQKKLVWDEAQQKIEGTRTMTEEEMATKKEMMAVLESQLKDINSAIEKDKAKLDWMNGDAEMEKSVKSATEAHSQAMAIVDGNEFKKKVSLVEQWNATIDARNWLTAKTRAEQDKTSRLKTLLTLESDYIAVLKGFAFAEQEKKSVEETIRHITSQIESEKEKATVYENAQTIVGYLNTIIEGRERIDANNQRIDKEKKILAEELQPAFEKAQKETDEAQTAFEKQQSGLKTQEEEVAKLHLNEQREQRDKAQELLRNIETAYDRMEWQAKEKERIDGELKRLQEKAAEIKVKKKEAEEMEPLVRDAKVRMESCKETLDKQSDTIHKFAKTLRQKLQIGDTCPICRQEIKKELPHEEELAKLVGILEESYKEAETAYNNLVEKKNQLDAMILSLTRNYQIDKDRIDKDKSIDDAAQRVVAACKTCGLERVDADTPQVLKSLKDKTEATLKELNGKIADGDSKEKAIREQRTLLDNLRKNLEGLISNTQKAQQAAKDCKSRIDTAQELVKAKQDEVKKAEDAAASYITGQWDSDWKNNPKEFSIELKMKASRYNKNVEQQKMLDTQLAQITNDNQMAKEVIEEILQLMPDWKKHTASDGEKLLNLLRNANDVKSNASTELAQLRQTEEVVRTNTLQLEAFLISHEDISIEGLADLNNYTLQQINDIKVSLDEDRKKVTEKKALMNEAINKLNAHRQVKPELKAEDTTEVLIARIKEYDNERAEKLEKRGGILQELSDDEKNKKQLGLLIEDANRKKADYQKWSRLNQFIGDATGNKFRKIAQSYVLNSLIHSANSYMKTLTDRYSLNVAPGTFVISLEDAYQGFVSRAASTISGGESFLVSLSLALALSDIGQQLSVDTLFIDEGFGTLSGEPLQNAINTLRSLHNKSGRHVGIISHVQELQERIPVQIQVDQQGNNSSSKVCVVNLWQ